MTREEAIKLIDTHTVCFFNKIDSPTLQALYLAIEALSAEPKTGEWVEHIGGISHELYYFCDQCYGEVDTNDYDFCPHCGARMKGGDDE